MKSGAGKSAASLPCRPKTTGDARAQWEARQRDKKKGRLWWPPHVLGTSLLVTWLSFCALSALLMPDALRPVGVVFALLFGYAIGWCAAWWLGPWQGFGFDNYLLPFRAAFGRRDRGDEDGDPEDEGSQGAAEERE